MSRSELTLHETRDMLIHVSTRMVESKNLLTQADKAIGDGDHGVGMARGFTAVKGRLENCDFADIGELLRATGMALMTSVGGAAGAIFGTLFLGPAEALKGKGVFGADTLSVMLDRGLRAIKQRGRAKRGDKSMVDALEPAASRAEEMTSAPLDDSLTAVTEAAREGMEKTKEMVATVGKAKTLGERSLGHPDPGAVSTYLILKSMAEYVNEKETSS